MKVTQDEREWMNGMNDAYFSLFDVIACRAASITARPGTRTLVLGWPWWDRRGTPNGCPLWVSVMFMNVISDTVEPLFYGRIAHRIFRRQNGLNLKEKYWMGSQLNIRHKYSGSRLQRVQLQRAGFFSQQSKTSDWPQCLKSSDTTTTGYNEHVCMNLIARCKLDLVHEFPNGKRVIVK